MGTLHQIFPKLFSCCSIAISSIVLYTTKLSFFIHHPKMMLGSSSNSAERRQKCTTTIRSRRAHPRRVLDTAALNAHVPDDVGSKSHNELTWNHVVAVFTFFGLLMTALVSLCCWSHVEGRRLAAEEFVSTMTTTIYRNKLPCYRRRLIPDKVYEDLPKSIVVSGVGDLNGTYKRMSKEKDIPEWFTEEKRPENTEGQIIQFGGSIVCGSTPGCKGTKKKDEDKCSKCSATPWLKITYVIDRVNLINSWKQYAGEKWYLASDNKRAIFFDQNQKKWHVCDGQKLYYRGNDDAYKGDTLLPFPELNPETGWYHDSGLSGKGTCQTCKSGKVKPPKGSSKCPCGGTVKFDTKPIFACGVKVDGEVQKITVNKA